MIYGGGGYARLPYAAAPLTGASNGVGNLTQAAGIGVAVGITPQVGGLLTQAAGIGVAAGISNSEFTFLIGAVGVGVAGNVISVSGLNLAQATGIGVAGQFLFSIADVLVSAVGIGRAGNIMAMLSGSGGARKKIRGGFEPIDKRPPEPVAFSAPKIPLPPFRDAPALAPIDEPPPELVDRNLIPSDMLGLRDQIYTAQDISDIEKFLADHDQDQQDIDDIADVLALLD